MLPWSIRRTLIHHPRLRRRVARWCVTVLGMVFASSLLALMIPEASDARPAGDAPLRPRTTIRTATVVQAVKRKPGVPRIEAMTVAPVGGWLR